jgi:TonB-dependent receptor
MQVNKFMFLAGVRYEFNEVSYDAYQVNNVTGAYTPLSDGTSYDFILPNIHIRYSINDLTNIRAAATWSYARANFSDIVPYLQIDEEGSNIRAGNPELKPASASNLDLMFERYLGTVGIISGGLFYKNIDDFQFTRNLRFTRPGDPYYEEFPGFQFRQEQNGENAQVYGFELNTQSALKFLPGFLKGFSVFFNYTYTASEAFTSDRSGIQLPGQAEHTWNGSLSYNASRFTLRASANYNGSFLRTVSGEARNDLIQEARTQIDINANFNITDQIRIFADFMNVTNAPAIVYQGQRERIAQYAFFGWWNRFGITYSL